MKIAKKTPAPAPKPMQPKGVDFSAALSAEGKAKVGAPFYDFYRDGVSQSFLANWLKCREKGKLGMVDGLTQVRGADAFSYGTLTHGCLEELYIHGRQPTGPEMDAAIKKALEGVKAENPRMTADALGKIVEQARIVRAVVEEYFKFWKQDFKAIAWVAREKEFKVSFELPSGRKTFIRGKRDGEFRAGREKRLFLFETKTKSRYDEDNLMDYLPLDLQVNLYFWSLRQDYPGEVPAGVKYNILKKPGLRQGVSETFDAFLVRIKKDLAKEPSKYFCRYDVAVLQEEIDTWTTDFLKILSEVEAWWNGLRPSGGPSAPTAPHYRNPTACITQYGACEFLKLCGRGEKTGLFTRAQPFSELSKK